MLRPGGIITPPNKIIQLRNTGGDYNNDDDALAVARDPPNAVTHSNRNPPDHLGERK